MRILIIAPAVVPLGMGRYGGVEKMIFDYLSGLLNAGQSVIVAAPQGSKVPNGVRLIETVKLPEEQDREDLAMDAIAKDISDRFGVYDTAFDVAHDFSHHHLLGLKGRQIPAVYMMWDPIYYRYPQKSRYNIVCVSQWQKKRFEAIYEQGAIVGNTGFIDTNIFKPLKQERSDRFLFLGKLSAEKGPDLALQYAKELDVPLDVVGGLIPSENKPNGYVDWLRQEVGTGGKWKIHFNVTEEEKLEFLHSCKALIYPVRQEEAHWLAGIEAWCTDTLTIANNRGALPGLMPSSYVASDKDDFLMKMKSGPRPETKAWGESSRAYYSVEACVRDYLSLYEKVRRGIRW